MQIFFGEKKCKSSKVNQTFRLDNFINSVNQKWVVEIASYIENQPKWPSYDKCH